MTNIATKNGSLVIKDGKLAEDCGCCGSKWYCCASSCAVAEPSAVEVKIEAEDFYAQYGVSDNLFPNIGVGQVNFESSACVFGSAISGTHALTKINASTWSKLFPASPAGCDPVEFVLTLSAQAGISYLLKAPAVLLASPVSGIFCATQWQSRVLPASQLTCGMSVTTRFCEGGAGPGFLWERSYYQTKDLSYSSPWPACAELPLTFTTTSQIEPPQLYARRSTDSSYGATVIATRQRSGRDSITVSVKLT